MSMELKWLSWGREGSKSWRVLLAWGSVKESKELEVVNKVSERYKYLW